MASELADRVAAIYEKHARAFDRDRQDSRRNVGWNDKGWHDLFIGKLAKGAAVLDLGCGSGRPVAAHLARHGLRVTGVDTSPTMIALCRERLPEQEWIVADMRGLALGRRFDGILAWDSFFHLSHDSQRRMFAVFADHAAASGLVMFNSGPEHGEAIGEYRGDRLYHASLSAAEYDALAWASGFKVDLHVVDDATAGGRTVWLCRRHGGPTDHLDQGCRTRA